jgi:hypothetical protein
LTLIPPVLNNTPEFAFWRAEEETAVPGLIRNRPGSANGGQAAWLPWPAGESYWLLRHAPFAYLLGDLMRDLVGGVLIETDAPASVQLTLHRQGGRPSSGEAGETSPSSWLLHLLNGTGREARALEQAIPLGAMRIAVHAPGTSRARSLVRGADLPCEVGADGRVAFTLPRLDAYDVIVLE